MKVGICSLGCKVNIYESELVTNILKNNNYTVVDFEDIADIYIINTCSVTNESDKKSRKMINRAKKNNPNAIIIVMGCYSQVNAEDIDVDIVLGNKDKSKIVDIIEEYKKTKEKKKIIYDLTKVEFEKMEINNFDNHTRAFVKIQDGCNAFCSYCIIPYVRGRVRSKAPKDVINEVTTLVEKGYKEIVLTGIHTGRYGIDINTSLEELLNRLVKIPNIYRIRLSSIEINEISDEIIDLIATNPKIANHLHIPVQALSNKVLKAMNRPYTIEEYKERIKYTRAKIPNISISTDLIVGFVGEDDETFEKSFKELDDIAFSFLHIFPYSRKSGTKADKMDGHIDERIKKERLKKISDYEKQFTLAYHQSFINKDVEVLVEKTDDNYSYGYTKEYIYVQIEGKYPIGDIIKANIKYVSDEKVVGIYVTK